MPFRGGLSAQEELGSAPSGRVGIGGAANLGLKPQAIQISPFQGDPRAFCRGRAEAEVYVPIESVSMDGKKLLHSITLKNLLSYGEEGVTLELEPLNVLIGPNASGKSNLIEAVGLLAAAPRNLMNPFREGGAVEDWLWKGDKDPVAARSRCALEFKGNENFLIRYSIGFNVQDLRLRVVDEDLDSDKRLYFYRTVGTSILVKDPGEKKRSILSSLSFLR